MSQVGFAKEDLDTPALWVDLDQLEENISCMARHIQAAGVQWRPHVKGIKVPAIAHKALAAGAIGITCAKLGEAEVMVAAGIDDILIANQIVGPRKLARLAHLNRHGDVKVSVDNPHNVQALGEAATAAGATIGVLVELDVGMKRAGVAPHGPALQLSQLVHDTPGLRYDGLMGWEGHATYSEEPETRARVATEAVAALAASAEQCRAQGLPVRIVSAGGSATLSVTPGLPGITEVQAGAALLGDVYYRSRQSITQPSLYVRSTVSSRPHPRRIVFDSGFKALPAWKRDPRPVGLPDLASIEMSAEHGVLTLQEPDHTIQIGDAFDFVVGYGDQTVFLYDRLYGIRRGIVETVWQVQARGSSR